MKYISSLIKPSVRKVFSLLTTLLLLFPLPGDAQGTAPVIQIVYSPDGARVASLDTQGVARVWDGRAPRIVARITTVALAIALPDAETLVGLTQSGSIYTWEIETGAVLDARHPDQFPHDLTNNRGALSADGRYVALGGSHWPRETSFDGLWWLWDTLTDHTHIEETYGSVYQVRFAPTGALLTLSTSMSSCGRGGGGVLVWDAAANEGRGFFTQGGAGMDHAVISPDGSLLAGIAHETRCVGDPLAWVWDIASGEKIAQLPGALQALAFSPDSRALAVVRCARLEGYTCTTEALALWEIGRIATSAPLMTTASAITALAFHPAGDLLTVGTRDGNVVMLPLQRSL
jgi:WD40 repeat protein